jgi:cell division protein FtsW
MVEVLKKYFKGDPVIWLIVFLLSILSVLVVYSSTGTLAYKYQEGNTGYYVIGHSLKLLFGFGFIFITHLVPYKYYSRGAQIALYISIPLLLLTLVMGTNINAASRWLTVPVIGITIQTSDLAKLALIMYVARMLAMKQDTIKDFKNTFIPIVAPVIIVCGLILPANLSTATLVMATCILLMFIGRISISHLLLLGVTGIAALSLFVGIALWTGSEGRVRTWINRVENFKAGESEDNYQADQAKIAVVTGGVLGKGPGNSEQRNFLPHPYSDFIYAIIVEEYGILGGVIILLLYLWLLFRAGMLVRKSDRTFPAFLSIGLAISLVFQAIINMGVAVNLLPVTGQTLPLVSMGGSSQLFASMAIGIILSVSRGLDKTENEKNSDEPEPENIPAYN